MCYCHCGFALGWPHGGSGTMAWNSVMLCPSSGSKLTCID